MKVMSAAGGCRDSVVEGTGKGGEEGRNQRSQRSAHGLRRKACHLDGGRELQHVGRLVALFQGLYFLLKPRVFQLNQSNHRLHLTHKNKNKLMPCGFQT